MEISPQSLIREFLKLTGSSVDRPFLLSAVFLSSEIPAAPASTCGGHRWVSVLIFQVLCIASGARFLALTSVVCV